MREVQQLADWPYAKEPFYIAQVQNALLHTISFLMSEQICVTWGFDDAALPDGERLIGFGVMHLSDLYAAVTEHKRHLYIPLLSIKPNIQSKGYGRTIVQYLVEEAERSVRAVAQQRGMAISDHLFLDVYIENNDAIKCYKKCGFRIINEQSPLLDEEENNAPYFVMVKKLV